MGWFADSMRLRDVIQVVSSIEIPIPGASEEPEDDDGEAGCGEASSEAKRTVPSTAKPLLP